MCLQQQWFHHQGVEGSGIKGQASKTCQAWELCRAFSFSLLLAPLIICKAMDDSVAEDDDDVCWLRELIDYNRVT